MQTRDAIAALQACATNPLGPETTAAKWIAGIVGAAPSRYSKSPALWNAAFAVCAIDGIYLPLDVEGSRLKELAATLRATDTVMGVNVTVPHKVALMDYLDEIDPRAERIQAVNTVVRTRHGRLIGYNTDGEGFIDSISRPQPGQAESFVASLSGAQVLLLGAGGSARAVAFHIVEAARSGRLTICNRTLDHGRRLADDILQAGYATTAIGEEDLPRWAPQATLIVNSTTKGQGGSFSLEKYSALAPAHPIRTPPSNAYDDEAIKADVRRNHEASRRLAAAIPTAVRFYDLIYYPEETVFLRHARETGHPTMNGKAMIVSQAALAFVKHICKDQLQAEGVEPSRMLESITQVMHRAW